MHIKDKTETLNLDSSIAEKEGPKSSARELGFLPLVVVALELVRSPLGTMALS